MMDITHQFYYVPGTDKDRMLKEARDLQKEGRGSIVHEHRYTEDCNEKCKEFR